MGYVLAVLAATGAWALIAPRIIRRDGTAESRELLALAYELFTLVRSDGRAALEAQAANWQTSSIFGHHTAIAADDVLRPFLVDALMLLVDDVAVDDLDQLLAASSRVTQSRTPLGHRAARRRRRMFDCIRRSVLEIRRGATPVGAIRMGRAALAADDRPSTQAITKIPELRTM